MNYDLNKRLHWLDAMRGFTMILVVAYHVAQFSFHENEKSSAALSFLVLMRMPLFFFVSGFLAYKATFRWTIPNALRLAWKKLKVQVIPAVVFLCIFIIFRTKGDFWPTLMRFLASSTKGGYWFTWVLLQMFLIYYMCCYAGKWLHRLIGSTRWLTLLLLFLSWAASVVAYETLYLPRTFTYHEQPFFAYTSLVQTIRYMQFFLLGNIVRRYWTSAERLFETPWFFPLVVTLAVVCCADIFQWHTLRHAWTNLPRTLAMYSLLFLVVMYFRKTPSYSPLEGEEDPTQPPRKGRSFKFLPLTGEFDGVCESRRAGRFLSFIGTRTLDIYLLHFLFLPTLPAVGEWLNANRPNFVASVVLSVSVGLVVIAFCLLLSQLLRVSPFLQLYLFGKRQGAGERGHGAGEKEQEKGVECQGARSERTPGSGPLAVLLLALLCLGSLPSEARKKEKRRIVRIETSVGNIRVALSDDTPLHSKNFLKLARKGFYDGTLFHRCIKNFMIQGGDPDSRNAEPGKLLGDGGTGYTIPAEFCLPYLYHWRGALAAAREPDDVNPEQESSGCQFYIVYGKKQSAADIRKVRQTLEDKGIELTPQMVDDYYMRGGTPHLDGQYTVFGEVISGMEVVKKIQGVDTDENDRPLEDIVVRRMVVEQ